MHLKNSLSDNFKNYLEVKKPDLVERFEEMVIDYDYHSDWALESYCCLLETLQTEYHTYLPLKLKQSIIFGDILYKSEAPEDTYKGLNFYNYIESNFGDKTLLKNLNSNFPSRLSFSNEYLSEVYSSSKRREDGVIIHVNALINALNGVICLPIFSTTKDYLFKTCIKYFLDGHEKIELALYQYILKSSIMAEINFEQDYEKQVLRYNGLLCSLFSYDLKFKTPHMSPNEFYTHFSSIHQIRSISDRNLSDIIRYDSSVASLIKSTPTLHQNLNFQKIELSQFL